MLARDPHEIAMRRAVGRVLHIDDRERIDTPTFDTSPEPDPGGKGHPRPDPITREDSVIIGSQSADDRS